MPKNSGRATNPVSAMLNVMLFITGKNTTSMHVQVWKTQPSFRLENVLFTHLFMFVSKILLLLNYKVISTEILIKISFVYIYKNGFKRPSPRLQCIGTYPDCISL